MEQDRRPTRLDNGAAPGALGQGRHLRRDGVSADRFNDVSEALKPCCLELRSTRIAAASRWEDCALEGNDVVHRLFPGLGLGVATGDVPNF